MQDRYTGDIGDFVTYGLLRAVTGDRRLGIAWYRVPNENHNDDGRHTEYLAHPMKWANLDPHLFSCLKDLVATGNRTVEAIEASDLLPNATFANELLYSPMASAAERGAWRREWFNRVLAKLKGLDIVFADPDNGLCEDEKFKAGRRKDWKRMPLAEAKQLSQGRTAIFYHHNSRFPGGHHREIKYWMDRLPGCAYALYWRRFSNRTFFFVDPTADMEARLNIFTERWNCGAELISNN